jgi:DNA repair protein RecN (Recombination protein N)
MLKELRIKNFAIIDDLKVRFEKGLNVLTGETGAGKSIIVDSLGLALGGRSQSDLVRSGEKEAVVQAYFEPVEVSELPDIGIDFETGLILRRAISASGRSRAFINDNMVSLQSLAEFGRSLVDIHGQHEHQSLLSVERHRLFLDAFGRLREDAARVGMLFREVSVMKKELADLKEKVKERAHRLDLLRFQLQEIDGSSLRAGEKEELVEKRIILSNIARLRELAETAYAAIYGSEGSCIERLSYIIAKVREMSSADPSVSEILNMLESGLPLIEDAAVSLRRHKERYDIEPASLADVEDRLESIGKLEKKYGEGIENIIRYRDNAERELKELESSDERIDICEKELGKKQEELLNVASSLSGKRKRTARRIEELVTRELKELALGKAEFVIDVVPDTMSASGADKVEFLFSANPGENPRPLQKIASGGELSRVMLALKSILADFDSIPVLIFDEVDTGIGGKTAISVGKKLREIADKHQVLCTTHLPQIASQGDFHLKIEKAQRGQRVSVEIKELSGADRVTEVARMLSGKVTQVSLKHAQELIEGAA